ncbi:aryl-alcohol dehydrogenase-like predicted oxidoreductase [Curtobacterium flaccumfaciens]|uniref:Aryl-alcohol dehydrogenase-like predicted oxidoreductase n=1 Tax=Curtobacterium salicis TaxID=1779862 RepID=A0ABX0T470_9MICO|nr:oxidoreductase [Curtobacterium sp. WW7]NII40276.1 aryl-alcohol dehydrogenase-like predicted oxidoreductase [Curtobacterium sp. WW7]
MTTTSLPGGTFRLADDLELTRVGYGAMQLAGPHVFGPPADRDEALRVLRTVVELGITHIDTAEFYGPHVTNELIREALSPYGDDVHIVTKVGSVRDAEGNWVPTRQPDDLVAQVHENLRTLGLEQLEVVNIRMGGFDAPESGSIAPQVEALARLQEDGLVRHIGLSTVSAEQLAEAQSYAPIVCVQNMYNVARREDDALVDLTASQGIAYVPYFPLGGFSPIQSGALDRVAERLEVSRLTVALSWLLQRSPNMLLIPGTSSVDHLRDNVASAGFALPDDAVAELDAIGSAA